MLSQHAVVRMQQRGIQPHDIEVLLQHGRSVFHRGREGAQQQIAFGS